MKQVVAVFIGGRSPEHDVSVVSGLQALNALDSSRFEAFPVYVSLTGEWYVGEALRDKGAYIPTPETRRKLTRVTLDTNADPMGRGRLVPEKKGLFGKVKPITFDVALLSFHGLFGEDGGFQGLFEVANVPYTGMRVMASSVLMDKAATKRMLAGTHVPQLPCVIIDRPRDGTMIGVAALQAKMGNFAFPLILKPAHLGSSIGVSRVQSFEEIVATLPSIFSLDHQAMVEPFVENLVEYNVAVSAALGGLRTSAIERPKRASELLDFKQKYMSGGGNKKGGGKTPGQSSEGMLSLTRDINPKLPDGMEAKIRGWAETVFTACGGSGAPRLDFLSNEATGEVWFNEANPCPGSFGFFLWEAAHEKPVLYTEFLTALVEEACALHRGSQLPPDPTLRDARLFPRPFNA